MKNVLLLGGSGFIGSNVADYLIRGGFNVIVLDVENTNLEKILKLTNEKIKIIKGSLLDDVLLLKIFKEEKIDVVINLVSTILPENSLDNVETDIKLNLFSLIKLLDTMQKCKTNKIIFFSSGGTVYGKSKNKLNSETHETEPINLYGWIKLASEKYIQMFSNLNDLQYIIVRPSNAYGRNQNLFGKQGLIAVIFGKLIKKDKLEIWGDGNTIRDYIYIDDLCEAILLLMKKEKWNQVYNIGSGIGLSINQIIEIIEEVTNENIIIEYKGKRKIDVEKNILDINKLKIDTGFDISTDIRNGIKLMWNGILQDKAYDAK